MNHPISSDTALTTRRGFLKTSATIAGVAALGPFAMSPNTRAASGEAIRIGLTGCGGRGTWIAELFKKHDGYQVVAVHDFFQDKADNAGTKLGVPENRRYSGLDGYLKMLESGLDAVAIESPPYFHPEQAAQAVEAGKHVYLAKPIAVDVPGCTTIAESGKKATSKKQVFLADFQTRAMPAYQEVVKRVHAGEIGAIKTAEAAYQCSLYFAQMDADFRKSKRDATARLRAWAIDRVLSGDIITEQNIHALDVATWFLNAEPIKAVGTGGRARDFLGDCWDHFALVYTFPQDVILTFSSKQFGFEYDDIMCRVYGVSGTADTHYGGKVWIRSKDDAFTGDTGPIYAEGATRNIAAFHEAITKADFSNPTVAPSVRSNLTTILGRTAAYKKSEVTWADMMRINEKWEFDTKSLAKNS
ncbi:MAG TPA: Gfo/Idh/MocA family oxidoreductase [Candidatus Paceibacterota bacterium]|nr:Gfo/Idh/MocA family oxidoreductase [Verrucomicrobiota bacterium]HRY49356.1 Gfo/Idh/MocA family oxidoreductase [Candidatus Paceibacterota bacterium]